MKKDPYIGHALSRIPGVHRARMSDATETREHLRFLQSIGMTCSMIARAAGTSSTTPRNIMNGQAVIAPEIERALLAVTPRPMHHQALVLSFSTIRRMNGLAFQGWSLAKIGTEVGMDHTALHIIRRGQRTGWRQYESISRVYDAWHLLDGGNLRTKRWAAANGFVHPLDWDDIDDWFEQPAAPERLDGQQYRAEEVTFLRDMGLSDEAIAGKLGITLFSLQQWERRYREVAA